jgi:hypothetical protein
MKEAPMSLYVSSPDATVAGVAVLALTQSMEFDQILPVARKYGLEHIEADQWYPEQNLLDFLKELEANPNSTMNFVSIGVKVFETMPLPPEIDSLETFLRMMPSLLQMVSRNAVGIQVEPGECSAIVMNTSPYPDDIVYGEIWGAARRLMPNGGFNVKPLPKANSNAVSKFEVTW